jgi:septal ring factor EnvC (AmiA/AmiB activator)
MGIKEKFNQLKRDLKGDQRNIEDLRSDVQTLEKENKEMKKRKSLDERRKELLKERNDLKQPGVVNRLVEGAKNLGKKFDPMKDVSNEFDFGKSFEVDSFFDDKEDDFKVKSPLLKD